MSDLKTKKTQIITWNKIKEKSEFICGELLRGLTRDWRIKSIIKASSVL